MLHLTTVRAATVCIANLVRRVRIALGYIAIAELERCPLLGRAGVAEPCFARLRR